MNKEQIKALLTELLDKQFRAAMTGDDSPVGQLVKGAVDTHIKVLQETLSATPVDGAREITTAEDMVKSALPFTQIMGGNIVSTPQGSILDLSKKHAPWVRCSEEVSAWALAFSKYLATKGKVVGKVLQEADDTAGGLELVLMGYGAYQRGH